MVLPPIPKIRKLLLEFLAKDSTYHSLEECVMHLILQLPVSEEDQQIRYEGKHKEKIFKKRVTLVVSEFRIAQLIEDETKPGNASFRISSTGSDLYKRNYEKITNKILKDFGGYTSLDKITSVTENEIQEEKSEEETIQDIVKQYEQRIQLELLQEIKNRCNSKGFIKLCLKLFEEMGFGESKRLDQLGNKEIDGIISEDKLGLNQIYVKTKKSNETTQSSDVDQFHLKCIRDKVSGIFVTTSNFSQDTMEILVKDPSIKLINGKQLAKFLYQFNVGIEILDKIELKQININVLDSFN